MRCLSQSLAVLCLSLLSLRCEALLSGGLARSPVIFSSQVNPSGVVSDSPKIRLGALWNVKPAQYAAGAYYGDMGWGLSLDGVKDGGDYRYNGALGFSLLGFEWGASVKDMADTSRSYDGALMLRMGESLRVGGVARYLERQVTQLDVFLESRVAEGFMVAIDLKKTAPIQEMRFYADITLAMQLDELTIDLGDLLHKTPSGFTQSIHAGLSYSLDPVTIQAFYRPYAVETTYGDLVAGLSMRF